MAISDNYVPIRILGNGVTTVFTGSWRVISASYMRVYLEVVATGVQTLQTLGVDYTLAFNDAGFTVTFTTAPTSANYVVIARSVAQDNTAPYKTSLGFQGYNLETSLDKLTAMVQDVEEAAGRAFKYQVGVAAAEDIPSPQADKYLKRNTANDGFEWSNVSDYNGTSSTSLSVGTGSKAFETQSGKSWIAGLRVRAISGANIMDGVVTSYSGTTLTILSDYTEGSGTHASWSIALSGARGATGPAGGPLVDGDYGDVTVSGSGTAITVDGSSAANFAVNNIQTTGSSGVSIKNSGGATVLTVGPANTTNATFAGALNITGQTNFTGNAVMADNGRFTFGAGTVYATGNATNGDYDIYTASTLRSRIDVSGFQYIQMTTPGLPSSSASGLRLGSPASGPSVSSGGAVTTSQQHWLFINGNGTVGSITTNGTATAFNTSSDYRLKQDIIEIPDAVGRLKRLKPYEYVFKSQPQYKYVGFLAHELKEVCYEAVTGYKDQVDEEGNPVYQGVDHSKLVPILTAALQDAIKRIEVLEAAQ